MEIDSSPRRPVSPASRSLLGQPVRIGYLLAAIIFVGTAWIAVEGARSVRTSTDEAGEIIEFLGSLGDTFSLVQDMETGQRGYLLTKESAYLEPYRKGVADLTASLKELRERGVRQNRRVAWLEGFERLVSAKEAELSQSVALVEANQLTEALAVFNSDRGRELMDQIRKSVADREDLELQRLNAAKDNAVAALERAAIAGVGAAILGIGIVTVSIYRLRSELAAREKLADDLFRQREELRVTLLSIGDGVITTDANGRVDTLNGMAEKLTGWSSGDANGYPLETVFNIVNQDTREPVENPATRALREGKIVGLANHTILIRRDGAECAIDDSAAPIRSAEGELLGAVLVFRDVTEHREAQAALMESQRRKDDFLAMLGHELRNPLAGILSGVQVLRMLPSSGDAAKMQEVIERQAAHMSRMVDDLLDTSRFARGKLTLRRERLDLRELLHVTVEDYRNSQLIEDCEFEAVLPDGSVWVYGDRTRLAQAVSNLIHNACKFCDGPNHVKVELRVDSAKGSALIDVTDRGIGMNAETLANIFQPFIQADTSVERSRGGLGLGLALVQGLVTLHEGEISAFSDGLGLGSKFSIRIPLCTLPAEAAPRTETLEAGAKHRVLVVDDRRDAVLPLEKMLQMDGHEVRTATNGAEGLAAARSFQPTILMCDIGLADGMNGYDVARQVRSDEALATTYLVAVTGYGQEDDRQSAQAAGFDYHLTKPVGKQELLHVIRNLPRFA
jgi:PAS domain S-box-containing protein